LRLRGSGRLGLGQQLPAARELGGAAVGKETEVPDADEAVGDGFQQLSSILNEAVPPGNATTEVTEGT